MHRGQRMAQCMLGRESVVVAAAVTVNTSAIARLQQLQDRLDSGVGSHGSDANHGPNYSLRETYRTYMGARVYLMKLQRETPRQSVRNWTLFMYSSTLISIIDRNFDTFNVVCVLFSSLCNTGWAGNAQCGVRKIFRGPQNYVRVRNL